MWKSPVLSIVPKINPYRELRREININHGNLVITGVTPRFHVNDQSILNSTVFHFIQNRNRTGKDDNNDMTAIPL
jgi:hypothetical protein